MSLIFDKRLCTIQYRDVARGGGGEVLRCPGVPMTLNFVSSYCENNIQPVAKNPGYPPAVCHDPGKMY